MTDSAGVLLLLPLQRRRQKPLRRLCWFRRRRLPLRIRELAALPPLLLLALRARLPLLLGLAQCRHRRSLPCRRLSPLFRLLCFCCAQACPGSQPTCWTTAVVLVSHLSPYPCPCPCPYPCLLWFQSSLQLCLLLGFRVLARFGPCRGRRCCLLRRCCQHRGVQQHCVRQQRCVREKQQSLWSLWSLIAETCAQCGCQGVAVGCVHA